MIVCHIFKRDITNQLVKLLFFLQKLIYKTACLSYFKGLFPRAWERQSQDYCWSLQNVYITKGQRSFLKWQLFCANASVKDRKSDIKNREAWFKVCHTARNVRDILAGIFFFSLKINILPEYFIFIWKLYHIFDSKFMISWSHCLMKILNSMCILILNSDLYTCVCVH